MRDLLETGNTDNISNAFNHLDIEEISNRLYFGPQAEVMEELSNFNDNHRTDLKITKKFRWAPGTYDKVKEYFTERLGFSRKANAMHSLLSRENYFRRHGWNTVKDQLTRLDNKLVRLRWGGASWLEDPSVAIERMNLFSNHIEERYKEAYDFVQGCDDIMQLYWTLEYDGANLARHRYILCINIVMSPLDGMNIYRSDRDEGTAELIQNIPVDMNLVIRLDYWPVSCILNNDSYDNDSLKLNYNSCGTVEQRDARERLRFPYLSSTQEDYYGSICYGDMSNDIGLQLRQFNLLGYIMSLTMWAKSYNQHTGPHHNIKYMYSGEPKYLNEDYRAIFGTKNTDMCTYEPSGEDDVCDTSECTLRHVCERYKYMHPEPVTAEQAQQMTLEWATRMGGVNNAAPTITHSVNDNGEPTSTTPAIDIIERANTSTGNIHGGEAPDGLPIQGDREQDHIDNTNADEVEVRRDPQGRIIPIDDPRTIMEQAADAEDRPDNLNWEVDVERIEAFLQDIEENPEPDEGDNHEE
jgi:hypothetical protein